MKELEYPFDSFYIMQNKRRLRKELLNSSSGLLEKRIAILSGSTIGDIKKILELFLLNYGIKGSFYEGQYNRYYEEIMFENQELDEFKPDLIYIHTSNKNVEQFPEIDDDMESVQSNLINTYKKYETLWKKIREKYHCPVIQNNFDPPSYRVLGNSDVYSKNGKTYFLNKLNEMFYEYASDPKHGLYIHDISYLAAWVGLERWANSSHWYLYKYAFSIDVIPVFCYNLANIIKSLFGKNKKALVLDLDNTLWGGVIGDDGVENLKLGIESPEGMAFSEFQKYLKDLSKIGVLLNINSKNEKEIAMEGFSHPGSILKKEDFIEIYANWDNKDMNMKNIIHNLNILPDSVVFLDDNPVERENIRCSMPEVTVLELDKPEQYLRLLDRSAFFETTILSEDDKKRTEFYKSNKQREEQQAGFEDYHEYLLSLKMRSCFNAFNNKNIARVTQLINKTNQFNLTTVRYVQDEVERMAEDENYVTLCADLQDKFGNNGIVSALIGQIEKQILSVKLWIMSCRVFKRELEYAMFDMLVNKCKKAGIDKIEGSYIPTKKNAYVSNLYNELGFVKVKEEDNVTYWEYVIPKDYTQKNNTIEVVEDE